MNRIEPGTCPECGCETLEYDCCCEIGYDEIKYPYNCIECKFEGEERYSIEFVGHWTVNGDKF